MFYLYENPTFTKVNCLRKKKGNTFSNHSIQIICYIKTTLSIAVNHKKIGMQQHPHSQNILAKTARMVYNQTRNRRILVCPAVIQSETFNLLKLNLTD